METLDFAPTARTLSELVEATRDDQLGQATPCPAYTVADLLDHLSGLTFEFIHSARKQPTPGEAHPVDGARLAPGWRDHIAGNLAALSEAWADPAAYTGTTHAGPVELPGALTACVALNELVVHGWDLAHATGQRYQADPRAVAACTAFVDSFDAPAADDGGLFGPPVTVGDQADALERLIGLTGRDPAWPG